MARVAGARIDGNDIEAVQPASLMDVDMMKLIEMADGLLVDDIQSGLVSIENNRIVSCQRAGIIVRNAGSTSVQFGTGNLVAGCQGAEIALQKGSAEAIAEEQDLESIIVYSEEGLPENSGLGDLAVGTELMMTGVLPASSLAAVCMPPECTD